MKIDNSIQKSYTQLATAKKINSAADDPSGLAISQKLTALSKGYEAGTNNAESMKDLATTAEGSLNSIHDNLQRIRELAVQASNGTYSSDDKAMIQEEINQLKNDIGNTAKNTEFNTIKVLDGSFSNKTIASSPSGTGQTMTIESSSLETLGIADFDVTGSFDLADVDSAITKVSDSRANIGATTNAIQHEINNNKTSQLNMEKANDQIESADIAQVAMNLKTQQIKQQVQTYAQNNKMNQNSSLLNLIK